MAVAYEGALIELQLIDRNDPLTELIARAIVNVTATGERDPENIKVMPWMCAGRLPGKPSVPR